MQLNDLNSSPAELDLTLLDLGPLAWVLEELRKSLEASTKALKRFIRESEAGRDSDIGALDAGQLLALRLCSALVGYGVAFHIIVAPFPRYGVPFRPFLYALAMFALAAAISGFARRRRGVN